MSDDREIPGISARIFSRLRVATFYLFSAVYIPVIVAAALLLPGKYFYYRLVRLWVHASLRIFGIAVTFSGVEHLDPGRDYVLLANHRSHFDSFAIVAALGERETRWVAKRELTRIPLFGYGLRVTGQILVDRGDNSQAVAALRANVGKHGATVVFFAEGQRSKGRELRAFKKGGAAFAIDAGLPVVPVAISGSEMVLPKHSLLVLPGVIHVSFGEPIRTLGLEAADRDALTHEARQKVLVMLDRSESASPGI